MGTMNLVSAKLNNDEAVDIKKLRNIFLEVDKDAAEIMDLSGISHTVIDDAMFFIAEDAYNFANILGKEASRPMSNGMISTKEIDSVDILAVMVKELIGTSNGGRCCYSIPADPIDNEMNVIYHQNVFGRIINELGFQAEAINEATAIVYTECEESNFSGIGISFGAGMTNVALVYKAIPTTVFSIARGGDWIDLNTANSTGSISNRVTLLKENSFSLNNHRSGKKKDRKIKEALVYYYHDLINYTIKSIVRSLENTAIELPESLPVIISGGTSMVDGFVEMVRQVIEQYEFPFEVSEIRHAGNPLTAVAEGCLIRALKYQN
ncbi:hypothetical protein [Desulfosarcina variabilis]|uniref:hypothetical protein n=1 Tax=Desulfosarcina variabilis TaxID=2300 RepID=UPI003AFA5BC9